MSRVLAIGDLHIPFEHPDYLSFVKSVKRKYKCDTIVSVGDVFDFCAISFHDTDPDGLGASDEASEADKHIKAWIKAFPEMKICYGNHDLRILRSINKVGLPQRFVRTLNEIFGLPDTWEIEFKHIIDDVRYQHGDGFRSPSHLQAMIHNRRSTVIGHNHSTPGIEWRAWNEGRSFGMNVGCGIDRHAYAFRYSNSHTNKQFLSCGVVIDGDKAHLEAMGL